MTVLASHIAMVNGLEPHEIIGTVAAVRGLSVLVDDLPLPVGALVRIERGPLPSRPIRTAVRGEIVGFERGRSIVILLGNSAGLSPGMLVIGEQATRSVQVGQSMLGRVIDGLGHPIDGGRRLLDTCAYPLTASP